MITRDFRIVPKFQSKTADYIEYKRRRDDQTINKAPGRAAVQVSVVHIVTSTEGMSQEERHSARIRRITLKRSLHGDRGEVMR